MDTTLGTFFITIVFVENMVFTRFLGLCPFFGMSKNFRDAFSTGIAVILIQVLAISITWPIYYLIVVPLKLSVLKTMIFILVIASCIQILEIILKNKFPKIFHSIGAYLTVIAPKCAILGAVLTVTSQDLTYTMSLYYALFAALGYMLALLIMTACNYGVRRLPIPKSFQGMPAAFITAGVISFVFSKLFSS
ncbi:MAG: electron transport complex protein RnfA [Brevinemataceae bacterium]